MLEDKIKKYLLCFKKQKCPACGEKCISYFRKCRLNNIFHDNRCPSCGQELRLNKTSYKISICLLILYLCVLFSQYWFNYYLTIFMVLIVFVSMGLINCLFVEPFARIEVYNSTPMDDLINWYGRVKKFLRRLFSKKNK